MEHSYRFRIYPTKEQTIQIQRTFGCCRFVYNYYLAKRIDAYKSDKTTLGYKACSADMTALKKQLPWLGEVDSIALQSSLRDLDTAYQNFFRRVKQGEKPGFPCFKSKRKHRRSYKSKCVGTNIKVLDGAMQLPKLGNVKCRVSRKVEGRVLSATVSQEASGKYYVSLCCTDVDIKPPPKTGELAELTAQIEALKQELWQKKDKLMAELNRKMEEMEEKKEQLEGQIYLLDSQIYAIRCYAGEVVNFTRIRSGKNAPDTEPIVVHQKLRFLDEDLGRLASLYEIQWNELDMFESFLKHSPYALDTFAPNERCIMLVRLSRTGKSIGRAMDNEGRPYHNMLDRYDYYHGKTVGIIIRNGENLYLGWTDENRVHISDDLILTRAQVVTETVPEEPKKFVFESERRQYVKEQREQRKRILDGLVSRTFVYNILQGVVDHSALLPLPKGVTLAKQSEYVIFSVADKWISDNKYGSFTDIIARCNQKVQQGDVLLTTQHLVPETDRPAFYPRAWENVRGRGERNRTHDCSVDDCTLYKANLVEYDPPIEMVEFQRRSCQGWMDGPFKAKAKYFDEKEGDIILRHYQTEPERHVFVSAEKSGEWNWNRTSAANARANFELYDGEYINLTYLNSVWLEYVVTNKSLGDWRIGGIAVDYAYAIRYLKTALDYIRKREEGEKALLDAVDTSICQDAEWPVKLSEWKLRAGVRTITEYQAKRFATALGKEAQAHG